jgi:hypothetical protein
MDAVRHLAKVINNKISNTLSDNCSDEKVDVIILSSKHKNYSISQWQMMGQANERSAQYHKNLEVGLDFNETN